MTDLTSILVEVSKGNPEAQYELGCLYITGESEFITRNETVALQLWKTSADQEHPIANYTLGIAYFMGMCGERCRKEAESRLCRAADSGCDGAVVFLCNLPDSLPADESPAALRRLRRGAELNCLEALYKLGCRHFHGVGGVEKNTDLAFQYFLRAANLGHIKAMDRLAALYEKRNYSESVKWKVRAREAIQAQDRVEMARCYEDGVDVERDLKKAQQLYGQAAELGDPIAVRRLAELEAKHAEARGPGQVA